MFWNVWKSYCFLNGRTQSEISTEISIPSPAIMEGFSEARALRRRLKMRFNAVLMSMVMFGGQTCNGLLPKLWRDNWTQKRDRNMREIIRIGFGLEFGKGCHSYTGWRKSYQVESTNHTQMLVEARPLNDQKIHRSLCDEQFVCQKSEGRPMTPKLVAVCELNSLWLGNLNLRRKT